MVVPACTSTTWLIADTGPGSGVPGVVAGKKELIVATL